MKKYDDNNARAIASSLTLEAIKAGFLASKSDGTAAGKNVVAFYKAVADGLATDDEDKESK
jgi:hypothetical protein